MKFVCEFVGGRLAGTMPLEEAEKLTAERSKDWSEERAKGHLVPRAELDCRPHFSDYAGPMWDGERRGGIGVIRYESWPVYRMMSN